MGQVHQLILDHGLDEAKARSFDKLLMRRLNGVSELSGSATALYVG